MVKISIKPWQEIVVHEVVKHELKLLVRNRVIGLREGALAEPLLWAEGVVFGRTVMPPTQDVVKDQLLGIIHYTAVEWASMPRYKSVLKLGGVTIPVIDAANTDALRDLAKELKKRTKR